MYNACQGGARCNTAGTSLSGCSAILCVDGHSYSMAIMSNHVTAQYAIRLSLHLKSSQIFSLHRTGCGIYPPPFLLQISTPMASARSEARPVLLQMHAGEVHQDTQRAGHCSILQIRRQSSKQEALTFMCKLQGKPLACLPGNDHGL